MIRTLSTALLTMALTGFLIPPQAALAQGAPAILSVLAGPVERLAAGGALEPGVNGMSLREGDRVKTGSGGLALVTFLNGSTVTVLSNAEVTVKQAPTAGGKSGIRLLIHAGRVWARVVQAAGRASSFTLESNEYAAVARDGLIGAEQGPDGFVCWTRRGELKVMDKSGLTDAVLIAGQRARGRFGLPITPEPFVASASRLEIRTSGPVLPVVLMPDSGEAAGFVSGGAEVNQVFGSLTEGGGDRWLVEVPGGHEGPYTVVLTGTATGPFTVRVSARYVGMNVYRQELKGHARPGEQLFTRFTQDVRGSDPRQARVREASFEGLRAWEGPVLASPEDARRPGVN